MSQIVLYLIGQKGYQVLNAAVTGGYRDLVIMVVVGKDKSVYNDFSEAIISLCGQHGLKHCARKDVAAMPEKPESYIAIAAGWRWLIREAFRQIIVFHDSLLPKNRGFNPLVTALLNRDPEVGVTAIIANKDFDCGDIIESRSIELKYPIKVAEAINSVSDLYYDLAQHLFNRIKHVDSLEGVPQDNAQASYSVWRDEEDYRIDWKNSADYIAHFIKCLSFPYKGASTVYEGRLIRILEAEALMDLKITNRDAGKILFTVHDKPVVICGAGLLRIDVALDDHGKSVLPFSKFRTRLK